MIKFKTIIKKMERKRELLRSYKVAPGDPNSETLSEYQDLGWAILLEGSKEWLFIGKEDPPPEFKVGCKVEVYISALH
jgi:hypothetical protein